MTTKIKIPKLDSELFEIVGYGYNKWEWSDKELGEHIAVMKCITRYFRGRDDCRIILYKFQQEYENLLSYKDARERKY